MHFRSFIHANTYSTVGTIDNTACYEVVSGSLAALKSDEIFLAAFSPVKDVHTGKMRRSK